MRTLTRILAAVGAAFIAMLIAICPLFHGIPAPEGLLVIVLALLVFLTLESAALLYYAITGRNPLELL